MRWLLNLIAILGLATLASMSFDCGHVKKPLPVLPPGGVACDTACMHAQQVCPKVVGSDCTDACDPLQYNRPIFAACLLQAEDCQDVDDCDRD